MVVGNAPEGADFVVVGAGPGGYAAALLAAQRGRKVTLIDRDGEAGVGGVCLRVGCIPSKALIESAELFHRAQHSAALGIPPSTGPFDFATFRTWQRTVVDGLTNGVRGLLSHAGVKVMGGVATLTEPNVLVVNSPDAQARFVQFKDCVLATGSTPISIPSLPFGDDIVDSTGALNLESQPTSMAVVGGGYIGLEIGIAFAKLGTSVTVIEAEDRLLPAMDAELAAPLARRLKELEVDVKLSTRAEGFTNGQLSIAGKGGAEPSLAVEKVLVAVGRKPNTADLGIEAVGARLEANGLIAVRPDRRFTDHIAAIGDITPGPALAHKATAEAEVAVSALCGEKTAFEPAVIPAVVFTDPEIATAGMSASQAAAAGVQVDVARVPLGASGRASTMNARNGYAQIVSDTRDGAIVGVHIVGPHASDLIAEGVLAIEMGATLEDLSLTIHPHPTLSEQLAEAAHLGLGHPIHVQAKRK
ncbi:MAG: dihydrolipoyl dehydrogenase [Gammaproteobacteria bacterium]|nr:dihydrolipoyl dehydrogenase [Gammaproteobacteria bacterium]